MEVKNCLRCCCVIPKIKNKHYCDKCIVENERDGAKKRKELNTQRNKSRDYSLDVGGKVCPKCKVHKEYSEYNKCYGSIDGYKSSCRDCQNTLTEEQKLGKKIYSQSDKRKEQSKKTLEIRKTTPEYIEKENKKKERNKEKRRIERELNPKPRPPKPYTTLQYMEVEGIKLCRTCGEHKEVSNFRKHRMYLDGYYIECKSCYKAKKKTEEKIIKESKVCVMCGEEKPIDDFYNSYTAKDGHKSSCKSCDQSKSKTPEHRAKACVYVKNYNSRRDQKLKNQLRKNINKSYIRYSENGKVKTNSSIGIDYMEIFQKMGLRPSLEHSIDHIIPCVVFDFDNPGHVFLCQHPQNLRWLNESENSSKQDKIAWSLIEGNVFLEAICLELGITKEDDGLDGRDIRVRLYEQDK